MIWANLLALLILSSLVAEGKAVETVKAIVEEKASWESLLEKGDADSLEKAREAVLALKGEEVVDGLIGMMKLGLPTIVDDVVARADKASPLQKMKIAHYARVGKDPKYVPTLMKWAESSDDMMVRELAIRSLADCGGMEVVVRLKAMLKEGGLDPFVEAAATESVEKLKKTDT